MTEKSHSNGKGSAHEVPRKRGAAQAAPGSRLAEAFEAVERFPVLVESRERVMRATTAETARVGDVIGAVESEGYQASFDGASAGGAR